MTVKAVLLDLGLTLTRTASFPEIYRRILARFGVTVSVEDILSAQKATENEFDTAEYSTEVRKEFWTNYNASVIQKLGVKENTVFLASQIDELWWECSHVQLFEDVEPTLGALKAKGLKLGLVSNGFKPDIEHVLGKLDLAKWFDTIVCIDSCNCAKPDKRIFLYALKQLGVKASEAVFVGDSIKYDYEGASAVGIKPFLIDREGKLPKGYDKLASLTDLLAQV
ncbi:MAG: HAD family hydrolase [Candidatus Bathyarchaeota archaeon]|nr:HAD family hydrolase [Candidatus Bathyarchaeota archaeon]